MFCCGMLTRTPDFRKRTCSLDPPFTALAFRTEFLQMSKTTNLDLREHENNLTRQLTAALGFDAHFPQAQTAALFPDAAHDGQ